MEYLRYLTLCVCLTAALGEVIDYKVAEKILYDSFQDQNDLGDNEQDSYEKDPVARFIDYMKEFDRVYTSQKDLFARHQIFVDNVEQAEALQLADNGTAEYGITQFSDLGEDELQEMTGLQLDTSDLNFGGAHFDTTTGSSFFDKIMNSSLHVSYDEAELDEPEEIDYRKKGAVSPVRQQGSCGSCWAFSAVGVVEAMYAMKTGEITTLSVQHLVDCDNDNYACQGGRMDVAFEYMMRNGVESDEDYPYEGVRQKCKADKNMIKIKVKSYKKLNQHDEDGMKTWLAKQGPLSIGINANGLQFYRRGVVDLGSGQCNPKYQNHALLLIGYGIEKKKDGSELPYWIVKNSWGTRWGESGYFRVRRGENTCGVSEFVHGAAV